MVPHHHQGAFGNDRFGRGAERLARFFGTPQYIIGQTVVVVLWLLLNTVQLLFAPFDPKPYILLNLGFSTQAAYAAPLILLAQTRQADRDKATGDAEAAHRETVAAAHSQMLSELSDLLNPAKPGGITPVLERLDEIEMLLVHNVARAEPEREPPVGG